jgi:hypothetical protein
LEYRAYLHKPHLANALSQYQMGCGPGTAGGTASQANGDVVGYIADNTSIEPAQSGLDLWFSHEWSTAPNLFSGGATYLVFNTEAQMPWDWAGQLVNNQWTRIAPSRLPNGYGGYLTVQINLLDSISGLSFYFAAEIYDSR